MLLLLALLALVFVFLLKGFKCSHHEGYDDGTTYKTVGDERIRNGVYTDEMLARARVPWRYTPYEYNQASGYVPDPEWYYSHF